ncbi:MAG: hypothetical protein ACKOED_06030, partial [Aestuariivirga sp.]|uniref:hypothetical protein n=1 Tax=Aestuariivirga sp. TaxID=2650926 RepID=UPI0038D1AC0D
ATGPGGLRAGHGRTGGGATPASFAARAGVEAVNALTFQPDHSVGADQFESPGQVERGERVAKLGSATGGSVSS